MPSDADARTLGPWLIALAAAVAVIATLGPGANGPGVTCDELYHVIQGKRLVGAIRHQGPAFFAPANIRRNFPWAEDGPPVQAPLGHWILGWTHHLFDPAPDDPSVVSIAAARFAPAIAFGVLTVLIGLWTTRSAGAFAGMAAAAATALVPHMFGHAHVAALDTLTTLFFVAAVLAVTEAHRRGRWWQFALAGCVWGLAMLVRLHGVLLLLPVGLWLVWQLRLRAMLPLAAWGAAGMATLYVGWPWLWLSPIGHLWRYVASGAERQAINVFYFGRVWPDHQTPWHYPPVMFAATLPLGLLVLGGIGLWAKRREWKTDAETPLLMGTLLLLLLVFAWPGTPVYDGVRLMLMVFPLWAVSVGVGAGWLVEHGAWSSVPHRFRVVAVGLLVALQGVGLIAYHPCQLSHYSMVVGGLAGAQRLGFEVSYWGDSVTEEVLARAAEQSPGGRVLFGPSLAPFQTPAKQISSAVLHATETSLIGWDASRPETAAECTTAVVYQRRADLKSIDWVFAEGRVVAEYCKQGVWLARVVRFSRPPRRTDTEH